MRNLTQDDTEPTRITVIAGAAPAAPAYFAAAAMTGRLLAEQGIHIIYSGGRLGLMGALANAALAAGGHVTGILHRELHELPGVAHPGLTDLQIVPDLATRHARLTDPAHAYLALPGGPGTLSELAYIWSNTALTQPTKPTGILDVNGDSRHLRAHINNIVATGFLHHHTSLDLDALTLSDDDPARLLHTLLARIPSPGRTPAPQGSP